MQAELAEEEKRLDAMMEAERRRALATDRKTDELSKEQRMRCRASASNRSPRDLHARSEVKRPLTCGLCSRGRQLIHEQIQKRLEDKSMQEEIRKLERQQEVQKQEKAHLEDLKVPRPRFSSSANADPRPKKTTMHQ